MKISVRGKTDGLSKRSTRYICHQVSELLLTPRLSKNIFLQIQYMKLDGDTWGYCSPVDYESRSCREFEILIHSGISKVNQVKTLVHEMVHLKQFAKGELKQYHNENYRWLGKRVTLPPDEYLNLPWEVEAVEYEKILCEKLAEISRRENITL